MDLSALIFVALAAAWAIYLVPKALKAHEVDAQTRSVDDFSDRLRVLARREAVSADHAELVVESRTAAAAESESVEAFGSPSGDENGAGLSSSEGGSSSSSSSEGSSSSSSSSEGSSSSSSSSEGSSSSSSSSERQRAYRDARARARAAARRRRVLGVLLTLTLVTGLTAGVGPISSWWLAVPVTLVGAWLVTCRLMVKSERAARAPQRVKKRRRTLAEEALAEETAVVDADEAGTEEIAAVTDQVPAERREGDWDPVPITLPTYVAKEQVVRTVRTIDLDATGVWSSGRNEVDSQLAREAAEVERAEKTAEAEKRATGS